MLKWLVAGGREGEGGGLPTITDDPLATISRGKKDRKNEVYSVNRFNPLFDDAMVTKLNIGPDSLCEEGAATPSSSSSGYSSSRPGAGDGSGDPAKPEAEAEAKPVVEEQQPAGVSVVAGWAAQEVPGPVWPEVAVRGTLPLRAGHVAEKVQKLNIQLYQQETARIVRNRDFVTSISVESNEDKEEEVVTGGSYNSGEDATGGEAVFYQNVAFHNEKSDRITGQPLPGLTGQPLPGLTGRAWPGTSFNYAERANLTSVPGMLRTPDMAADRCFGIRHKAMSPIGEEVEKDTRMNDSIVTSSLLLLTSLSPTDTSDSDKLKSPGGATEADQESGTMAGGSHRLEALTKAVISSRHASTLSRAVTQARRSFRDPRRSLRGQPSASKRRGAARRRERSRAAGGRQGGAEAMRELWERTGMKTNGRKLLIESEEDEGEDGRTNGGYQSDGSEVSVPRVRGIRKLPALRPGHRKSGSQSSTSSFDSAAAQRAGRPVLVRSGSAESGGSVGWEVRGGARLHGLPVVDLDMVQLGEADSDGSTKHVRFSAPRTRYSQLREAEPAGVWDRYYGTGGVEAGLGPARAARGCGQRKAGSGPLPSSDLVMERITSGLLRRKERKRRGLRCFCKAFCFLLLLTSFLLVIVAVSIFLSRGRNYFGSLKV